MEIEEYARIMVELAAEVRPRAEILRERGLDEAAWTKIDDAFQDAITAAMDDDSDGAPEIVSRYAKAHQEAEIAFAPPISIERFAQVTRVLSATGDLRAALARAGVTLSEYTRATGHYSRRFAREPELAEAFERALRST